MNYSATSAVTFHFLTLLVGGLGWLLSLGGMGGNPGGVDTPALFFYNFYLSRLRHVGDAGGSPREWGRCGLVSRSLWMSRHVLL